MRTLYLFILLFLYSCDTGSKEKSQSLTKEESQPLADDLVQVDSVNIENLEIKKFEFEQSYKRVDLMLREKELIRKKHEQSDGYDNPITLAVLGGLITIITGLVLKSWEARIALKLEKRKSETSIIVKASEANSYEEFVNILDTLKDTGLIEIKNEAITNFKNKKREIEKEKKQKTLYAETISTIGFIITADDFNNVEFKKKLQRFWQLYWLELPSIESKDVFEAMIGFGNVVKLIEKGDNKDIEQQIEKLKLYGYKVGEAINKQQIEKTSAHNI